MKRPRSQMSWWHLAGVLALGLALDGSRAYAVYYCGPSRAGCSLYSCSFLGNQTCAFGTPNQFNYATSTGYTYTPCTSPAGTTCPNPLKTYNVCYQAGYTQNAMQLCGTLQCAGWFTALGC